MIVILDAGNEAHYATINLYMNLQCTDAKVDNHPSLQMFEITIMINKCLQILY